MNSLGHKPATGGRPRRTEIAERNEKLLDAAQCLFVRDGYAATSIEAIARATCMSKKTIYLRYADKQALFRAVLFRMAEFTFEAFPSDTEDESSFEAGFRRRARILFDTLHDPKSVMLSLTVMREGAYFPEINESMAEPFHKAVIQPLCDYIAAWKAKGAIRDVEPLFVVKSLHRLLSVNAGMLIGGPLDADDDWTRLKVDHVCDLMLNGLRPDLGAA